MKIKSLIGRRIRIGESALRGDPGGGGGGRNDLQENKEREGGTGKN